MSSGARVGQSLVLASVLALLSYVPFEYVAKSTILVSVGLFVLDPIPPLSRLLSLLLCGGVLALAKIERKWREGQFDTEEEDYVHVDKPSTEELKKNQ